MAVLFAAPPATDVAVSWHPEATASPELRQRFEAELGTVSGVSQENLVRDPGEIARRIVARDVDAGLVTRVGEIVATLDEADVQLRAGELDAALAAVTATQERLQAAPLMPGASMLAGRAARLEARVHFARGDDEQANRALDRALALDPEAKLSTRDVPPALAKRWAQRQASLLEARPTWPQAQIETEDPGVLDQLVVEIDGVPGLRPVAPGEHYVVAWRPGHAPVADHVDFAGPWTVPTTPQVVPVGVPATSDEAQRVCDALELDRIVLAHHRDDRLGIEVFDCGAGFGERWVGSASVVDEGLSEAWGGTGAGDRSTLDDRWPKVIEARPVQPPVQPPDKKPWFKRAWVWVLVGGLVVGGVTTGVVLGTQGQGNGVGVDADDFLQP